MSSRLINMDCSDLGYFPEDFRDMFETNPFGEGWRLPKRDRDRMEDFYQKFIDFLVSNAVSEDPTFDIFGSPKDMMYMNRPMGDTPFDVPEPATWFAIRDIAIDNVKRLNCVSSMQEEEKGKKYGWFNLQDLAKEKGYLYSTDTDWDYIYYIRKPFVYNLRKAMGYKEQDDGLSFVPDIELNMIQGADVMQGAVPHK